MFDLVSDALTQVGDASPDSRVASADFDHPASSAANRSGNTTFEAGSKGTTVSNVGDGALGRASGADPNSTTKMPGTMSNVTLLFSEQFSIGSMCATVSVTRPVD
jgi:hypothetical protein